MTPACCSIQESQAVENILALLEILFIQSDTRRDAEPVEAHSIGNLNRKSERQATRVLSEVLLGHETLLGVSGSKDLRYMAGKHWAGNEQEIAKPEG